MRRGGGPPRGGGGVAGPLADRLAGWPAGWPDGWPREPPQVPTERVAPIDRPMSIWGQVVLFDNYRYPNERLRHLFPVPGNTKEKRSADKK